uniref:Chromosome 4 open reading frame 45 n=1 Tax=Spermophilus dauricus TaxID=99837 RepID=A0A8C9QAI7_SPEDA
MASVTYREPISTTVGRQMIFSGPHYVKDHLPKVHQHTSYIGEKRPVLEKTGDLQYLWRPASNRSWPAKYKHEYVGGVGWGIQDYNFINKSRRESGFHIKHGELTLEAINKVNHRYQNPWQPKPFILDKQGRHGRGFIAWNMSDYEDSNQRNSNRALMVRQGQSPLPRVSKPSRLPKLPEKEEV